MIRMEDFSEFSLLNESRINKKFCDVTIRVEDGTFPCHRIILFTTMKYFRSMLSGDYVEAENQEIKLNNVNAEDFEQLLTFIYGSSVPVSESNILRLLVLSNYLGLQTMEAACVKNIVENNAQYSSDSVVNIFRFACATRNITLVDVLIKSIAENFVRAAETRKLFRIPSGELLKIFKHPNLKSDGTVILNFLKVWIQFQPEEEKKRLPEILNAVKVEGEFRDWILRTLMNPENATHEPNSIQIVQENDAQGLLSDLEANSSKGMEQPLLLLVSDGSSYYYSSRKERVIYRIHTHEFHSADNKIKSSDCYLYKENYCNHCYIKLFSTGDTQLILSQECSSAPSGLNSYNISLHAKNESISNEAESKLINVYKGVEFQKSKLIGDNGSVNIFTVATVNGSRIYLYNSIEFLMYTLDQNMWYSVDGYKNVFAPSMSSIGSCLYMAGGLDFSHQNPMKSGKTLSTMQPGMLCDINGKLFQHYDVRVGKWSQLPNMKYVRCQAASCVYNDTIYVSGGKYLTYYENSNIEYYDTRAGKWSEFTTPMPTAKMGHCSMAYNNHLWFFDGQKLDCGRSYLTWFSYNLKENTWSEIFNIVPPVGFQSSAFERIVDVHPGNNN